MNELQIIRAQLDTEARHLRAVIDAWGAVLSRTAQAGSENFVSACREYCAFALARLEAAADGTPSAAAGMLTGLAGSDPVAGSDWERFVSLVGCALERRAEALRTARERSAPLSEWRELSRIDADSILQEREHYRRVVQARPADLQAALP